MNMSMGMYKAVYGHVDERLHDCYRHVSRHFFGISMDMCINILSVCVYESGQPSVWTCL